jgi:hypothetical protein
MSQVLIGVQLNVTLHFNVGVWSAIDGVGHVRI